MSPAGAYVWLLGVAAVLLCGVISFVMLKRKRILNSRKASRIIVVAAMALVAVLSVGFAMNRATKASPTETENDYEGNQALFQMESVYEENGDVSTRPLNDNDAIIHQRLETNASSASIHDTIYLGMTNAEVRSLFGEPDFSASGLMWYGYDDVGVFNPSNLGADGYIDSISVQGKDWSISELVNAAVKQHNKSDASTGEYPVHSSDITDIKANADSFTVNITSLYESYLPNGEYDVRRVHSLYSPLELSFAKNANFDYELTAYLEAGPPQVGNEPDRDRLEHDNYTAAMYFFVGAIAYDCRYGIGAGTAALTNVAIATVENECFMIQYFPGARLLIEEYDAEYATAEPGNWIIEYANPNNNLAVGRDGTDSIQITNDMIGIIDADVGDYVMKFEKYIRD